VCSALAAPGCGSTDTEVGKEPLDPLRQFLKDSAAAVCEAGERCCTTGAFSRETCEEVAESFFSSAIGDTRPDAYVIDADQAERCFTEARASDVCTGELPEACFLAIEGRVAPGEECRTSFECGQYFPTQGLGLCQTLDSTQVCLGISHQGDPCTGSCLEDGCIHYPELGSTARLCRYEEGLYCGTGNVCVALLPTDAPCQDRFDCAAGATCNGVCEPLVAEGQPCVDYDDCASGNECLAGVCTRAPAPGEACSASDPIQCAYGECTDGRCLGPNRWVCAAGGGTAE